MQIRVFIAIFGESLRFALQNIRANLLRTLLSLLGITIGVFCIISILTLIDSLEISIRDSVSKFGTNLIFVQKFPWEGYDPDHRWQYLNRPELRYTEMVQLQKRLTKAKAVCFNLFIPNNKLKYKDNQLESLTARAVSHDYYNAVTLNFLAGRYFTEMESQRGEQVVILGHSIAKTLFGEPAMAIDKTVEGYHRKLRVIGVLEKEGNGMGGGGDADHIFTVPLNFIRNLNNAEESDFGPTILVKGRDDISAEEMEEELEGTLRAIRKLAPGQEDNFALNKITIFTQFLEKVFGQINLYGWIIAGFSILVGGFGIANIMFVSVKERTPIIGIQKSLGAKGYFILIQFLGEAVILCVLGGLIGLLLIALLVGIINASTPMHLIITFKNIMTGIGISSLIGIISGYVPSLQAAKMDPIDAIRYNV